ncbi:polysaccharide deacetylase family protein [Yunchengibacter salinarum]|uniref:polysaccharide deacetylase family protein n=1 Tax=Yunchengibacter salinarum TaxID=3133399 RepID=UPI0035B629F3
MAYAPNRPARARPNRSVRARMGSVLALLATGLILPLLPELPDALTPPSARAEERSAVVLLYHRFAEERYASTNITADQFAAHMELMRDGGYNFISLPDLADRVAANEPVGEKTLTITVDDAYKSFMTHGWPRLKKAGIPTALFVATDPVDQGLPSYLSWDNIRTLEKDGVVIGHHTASHLHMPKAGVKAAMADVRRASRRFDEELGHVPDLFSYPFGEYSLPVREAIIEAGFKAAFAQYSGAVSVDGDRFSLPRFPLNENYGGADRFKLVSTTRALPVSEVTPQSPIVEAEDNPPLYGFTLTREVAGIENMACFPSHLGRKAEVAVLAGKRVEVRFEKPFPKGRNRINCTLHAGNGRWYWQGHLFLRPGAEE